MVAVGGGGDVRLLGGVAGVGEAAGVLVEPAEGDPVPSDPDPAG